MTCPPRDEFIRQAKADTLDPWFVLHLLVCEKCCRKHLFACTVRASAKELRDAEEELYWEPMDPLARDWMNFMSTYAAYFPETIN